MPDTLSETRWLTPWAVTMRYDESDDDLLVREETVDLAAAAVDWARAVVYEQAG